MFENILNKVPNQNSQEPWLMSSFEAWRNELWEKAKRKAIAAGDQIATTGSNLLAPTGERETRLAEEGEALLQGRVEDRLLLKMKLELGKKTLVGCLLTILHHREMLHSY